MPLRKWYIYIYGMVSTHFVPTKYTIQTCVSYCRKNRQSFVFRKPVRWKFSKCPGNIRLKDFQIIIIKMEIYHLGKFIQCKLYT